ncbi:MAG: adenine phosphoribosyltransferase [Nitrospinae bacterium]|nr:adenine phosphoribosyltransferase [Nitrospinota bacterium]
METLKSVIRDIPDFPKEGIVFKDITPLLANADALKKTIDIFKDRYAGKGITAVVGIEARGFIFASALAYALGAGTVLVRKPGKLPYKTFKQSYALEYGTDAVEIHQDAFQPGQKIVILDDVLATGGTVAATTNLIKNNFKVEIVEVAFLIELDFLKGREKIKDLPIFSLMHF